jgi:hypothetical protein
MVEGRGSDTEKLWFKWAGDVVALFRWFAISCCLFATTAVAADAIPHFRKRATYTEVREALMAAGWKPTHDEVGLRCDLDDDRCKDYPEVDACSEPDTRACRFSWIGPKGTVLAVATTGDKPVVVGVSCLDSCE